MNLLTHLEIITEKNTKNEVILTIAIADKHKQPYGVMHGGVSGILIETACSLGANANLVGTKTHAVGIDLTVSHLKAVSSGKITAIATPDRIGRTIQVWQTTIFNEDAIKIAVGRCTMSIVAN